MGNDDKIFRYWAVVAAGFEEVALDEMAQTLPGGCGLIVKRKAAPR